MLAELGKHEHAMWHFISEYKRTHNGCSPTYSEIGKAVGISSKDHVSRDLEKLEVHGCIRLPHGVARGIELLRDPKQSPQPSSTVLLPLLGVIHAGAALPTLEENLSPIDWLDLARSLVGDGKNMYLLRVHGDSMIDALVNDGDIVVMEQTEIAKDGDLVAVWLKRKQATTLKRFYRKNGWVVLHPENPTLREKKYKPEEVEVQGKVVCIIRHHPNPNSNRSPTQFIRPS